MNASEIRAASTADLVAFYNAHADKPVKRFADRAAAEKRCLPFAVEPAPVVAPKVRAIKGTRAESIAASWRVAPIAIARRKRHQVAVNGQEFNSVGEAFRALGLPGAKRIPFRQVVVANGRANFEFGGEVFHFELIAAE